MLAAAETVRSDVFTLIHQPTGRELGPYPLEDGSTVQIGRQTFTLRIHRKPGLTVQTKLLRIRIPNMEFRSASIRDCVEFLRRQAAALDPEKTGVNLVLNLKRPAPDPITISMRDVTLQNALDAITEVAGLSYRITAGSVIISEPE
jgi:hypothetical protein